MISFKHHEVRDLAWVFQGPGLLNPACFAGRCLSDEFLRNLLNPHLDDVLALDEKPLPLLDFLLTHPSGGRLGRYFENLFLYFLTQVKRVPELEANLQIRDGKKTIGELDFIYRDSAEANPTHLEVSIKFYLCIGETALEASDPRYFVGTLIEDRLDRKIEKIFQQQLRLPEKPAARERLKRLNLADPLSLGLMKGCFFYPSSSDWRNHPHPLEVSTDHHRGWWTTAEDPLIPCASERSRYIVLPFDRWLTPINGTSQPYPLYTYSELRSLIGRRFDSCWARPLNFELGIAEVEVANADEVREISRGNILHARWPAHARGKTR